MRETLRVLGAGLVAAVLLGGFQVALVMAGDSNTIGRLIVQTGTAEPTCATAAADGELCVSGDIETNSNIDVAGTSTLTGAVTTGGLTSVCNGACGTPGVSTAAGDLYVEDALEVDGVSNVAGIVTFGATLIGTGTSTIGWTVQSGANTACTTTCTTPCVFGVNTASATADIVDCADATADECLCAGAS